MIQVMPGTKVYLACRPVSMRYGFDGLAAQVQTGALCRSFLRTPVFGFFAIWCGLKRPQEGELRSSFPAMR
jgi:hypothetical protein